MITPNHVYAGSNKIDLTVDTKYVHPAAKQCNYTYSHPSSIQCNAKSEIDSLKSSVSNGKIQVANAITGKGVSASGNDTFATLANKIGQIQVTDQRLVVPSNHVHPRIQGLYEWNISVDNNGLIRDSRNGNTLACSTSMYGSNNHSAQVIFYNSAFFFNFSASVIYQDQLKLSVDVSGRNDSGIQDFSIQKISNTVSDQFNNIVFNMTKIGSSSYYDFPEGWSSYNITIRIRNPLIVLYTTSYDISGTFSAPT